MDNRTIEARSRNMSNIHSKDTKPEEIVRKYLFSQGFRFRKNVTDLPGKPDIVLPKYKTIVFVNGCFWHAHSGCKWFVKPKTRIEFWENKFKYNSERDEKNYRALSEKGWNVIVIWECELRKENRAVTLNRLIEDINFQLQKVRKGPDDNV